MKERNEIAYSYVMEVCNPHPNAQTTAANYEGDDAPGLVKALEDRFLHVEKNIIQSEVSKFNSMRILPHPSGAEFVDGIETQAKVLKNLGRQVTGDDKLTPIWLTIRSGRNTPARSVASSASSWATLPKNVKHPSG